MSEYALYESVEDRYIHVPYTENQIAVWSAGHNSRSTITEEDVLYLEKCFESGHFSPWPDVCKEHREWLRKIIRLVADDIENTVKRKGTFMRLWVVVVEDKELIFGHEKTTMIGLYGTGIMRALGQAIMEDEGLIDLTAALPIDDTPHKYVKLAEEMIKDGYYAG